MRLRTVTAAACALAICVALVAGAYGQVETELTPVGKRSTQWEVVGGAKFDGGGERHTVVTPYTVDFFATAFSPDGETGFFGGWECDGSIEFDKLEEECDERGLRRPAMYRLRTDPDTGEQPIERVSLPASGHDGRGFVAAIAWIGPGRALAVGGTGEYPRREFADATPAADPAGEARAWLYENGAWSEVEREGLSGMGALTAVDCARKAFSNVPVVKPGFCLAGGLQRMWFWRPAQGKQAEGFDTEAANPPEPREPTDPLTPDQIKSARGEGSPDFHFRVRQIRFNDRKTTVLDPYIVAVTSGCCSAAATPDAPAPGARFLAYASQIPLGIPGLVENAPRWSSAGAPLGAEEAAARGAPLPDSYYGIAGNYAVAAPGGLEPGALEPGSRFVSRDTAMVDPDLSDRKLERLRLLAVDGTFASTEAPTRSITTSGIPEVGDGPDWAVGSYKDSEQAVAYTTQPALAPLPTPFTCADVVSAVQTDSLKEPYGPPKCDLASGNVTRHEVQTSRRLVELPVYTLNALSYVPTVPEGQVAWAAGDRGALARLGGSGSFASAREPRAPQLSQRPEARLSAGEPFDPFRPGLGSSRPGLVPALADRPVDRLEEPAVEPYGTADATRWQNLLREGVASIAMSRDGSEGWAVGPGHPQDVSGHYGDSFTLQHFDGERWTRCSPDGQPGGFEPDPACAAAAPLLKRTVGGVPKPPMLMAIARIPLERDGDRANDSDFEAIAIGSPSGDGSTNDKSATVLVYREGRWQIDADAARVIAASDVPNQNFAQIAFQAPDDGWAVTKGVGGAAPQLYHYGPDPADPQQRGWPHGRWISCPENPPNDQVSQECGVGSGNKEVLPLEPGDRNMQLQIAGDTVFLAAERALPGSNGNAYPLVLSKKPDKPWRQEHDPACPDPSSDKTCPVAPLSGGPEQTGRLYSFSVADLGGGEIVGWMVGWFGAPSSGVVHESDDLTRPALGPTRVLMRRNPRTRSWAFRTVEDAADRYLPGSNRNTLRPGKLVSFRAPEGGERSFIMPDYSLSGLRSYFPPLEYDPVGDRWETLPAPWLSSPKSDEVELAAEGFVTAAAPDGRGGLWIAGKQTGSQGTTGDALPARGTFFYRYSRERRRPVFEDAASPVSEPISGLAGTSSGTVWVSTYSDRLYRYDRVKGWERVRIPGWDPGRIVTNPSSALAVAVNDDGVGVAVGRQGRIGDLSDRSVGLDPASGRVCGESPPPCGTGRDLLAAAVGPDGSAIVGGERLALLWRRAGGAFERVTPPRAPTQARITGLSMPVPGRAWLTLDTGEVWAGRLLASGWRWELESAASNAADERRSQMHPQGRAELHAVAVDAGGRGLAVGDRGAILERSEDGGWRRLQTGFLDNFHSVALPPGGYGDGALVGGGVGVILTRIDGRFRVARPADITDPLTVNAGQRYSGRIVGLAVSRGGADGEVEAWAASQAVHQGTIYGRRDPAPFGLLHYGGGEGPDLHPERRVRPLPDAPEPEPGELTLAAFGRSECQRQHYCAPLHGSNLFNERISARIGEELRTRRARAEGPFAAVFTGDVNTLPGRSQNNKNTVAVTTPNHPLDATLVHEQWRDLVAAPLAAAGVPVFAAPGKNDLSRAAGCFLMCIDTHEVADAGVSLQWRRAFADMPKPWGDGPAVSGADGVEFVPVPRTGMRVGAPEQIGGANTHYAMDVVAGDRRLARLVFVDNSFARSLSAGDAVGNPVEAQGGQVAWLERVLCIKGETCAAGGSREPGQAAVVVMNAPTYSYGPGGLDAVQADGSVLEGLLVRHRATATIAGRLGWNGLFYTLGPGVHAPCAGGEYPQGPPSQSETLCGQGAGAAEELPAAPGARGVADALRGLGAPLPAQAEDELGAADGLRAAIPNVIAASAGGRFGPTGGDGGEASDGYWHGYSVVRIRPSGEVVVEQRPILDWIGITAQEHLLKPGQRMTLRGYGREPLGTDTSPRIDRIDSAAITHRYDLVQANPEKPYLPKEDADGNYLPLDPQIAKVDPQTGVVKAGKGRQARTYAIAILSVADKAASWPLVFDPAKSFRARSAQQLTIAPPAIRPAVTQAPPPIQVLSQPPTQAPPTVPPTSPIATPTANLELPPPPSLPPTGSAPAAASPPPPPPPAPPAPPSTGEALPLSLEAPITPVSIVPTVIPPTPPPINPAPPGGSAARKEARQRQAATAKSEEGANGSEAAENGGDPANGPLGPTASAATRRDRVKPGHSFTALARHDQERGPALGQVGAGLGLAALALALGWTTLRPLPRPPERPAPAWSGIRSLRR